MLVCVRESPLHISALQVCCTVRHKSRSSLLSLRTATGGRSKLHALTAKFTGEHVKSWFCCSARKDCVRRVRLIGFCVLVASPYASRFACFGIGNCVPSTRSLPHPVELRMPLRVRCLGACSSTCALHLAQAPPFGGRMAIDAVSLPSSPTCTLSTSRGAADSTVSSSCFTRTSSPIFQKPPRLRAQNGGHIAGRTVQGISCTLTQTTRDVEVCAIRL
mmetsp:Transcript_48425/g.112193  ORF Transcript_48425/g.112193 Transcript_48425/m.112193 type:complete len:218 (-) Transcript_48425:788-1441(-)